MSDRWRLLARQVWALLQHRSEKLVWPHGVKQSGKLLIAEHKGTAGNTINMNRCCGCERQLLVRAISIHVLPSLDWPLRPRLLTCAHCLPQGCQTPAVSKSPVIALTISRVDIAQRPQVLRKLLQADIGEQTADRPCALWIATDLFHKVLDCGRGRGQHRTQCFCLRITNVVVNPLHVVTLAQKRKLT